MRKIKVLTTYGSSNLCQCQRGKLLQTHRQRQPRIPQFRLYSAHLRRLHGEHARPDIQPHGSYRGSTRGRLLIRSADGVTGPPKSLVAGRWHVRTCQMDEVREMAEIQFKGFHRPSGFFLFDALSRMNFRAEVVSALNVKMLLPSGYRCLVVERSDGVAGGIADISIQQDKEVLDQLPTCSGSYAYLSSMAVAEPLRRQGAARALLRGAEKAAGAWEQTHLALHLHEDNESARKLYERAGFKVATRRTPFLGRTRLLMLKAVKP